MGWIRPFHCSYPWHRWKYIDVLTYCAKSTIVRMKILGHVPLSRASFIMDSFSSSHCSEKFWRIVPVALVEVHWRRMRAGQRLKWCATLRGGFNLDSNSGEHKRQDIGPRSLRIGFGKMFSFSDKFNLLQVPSSLLGDAAAPQRFDQTTCTRRNCICSLRSSYRQQRHCLRTSSQRRLACVLLQGAHGMDRQKIRSWHFWTAERANRHGNWTVDRNWELLDRQQ